MTRLLILCPDRLDADARAHLAAIGRLRDVAVARRDAPAENRLSYILRSAGGLFRDRNAFDVVLSVGEPALAAANARWRGPLIHVPLGAPTPVERSLCRARAGRGRLRFVTTSARVARDAMQTIDDPRHVHVIRPEPPCATLDRSAARAILGVADDAPLVYLPGHARRGSGHRLALWTTSILAFRDPKLRVLVVKGGAADAFVTRFATNMNHVGSLVPDAKLSDADLAVAADVALCTADGSPEWTPLAALRSSATPIVMPRSLWHRERFAALPARLAALRKPRLLARAILDAMDAPREPAPLQVADSASAEWAFVLEALSGTRRAANVRAGVSSSTHLHPDAARP